MTSNTKSYGILTIICLTYLFLGVTEFYWKGFVFFFPIIALPLAIWSLGNKRDIKRDLIVQGILVVLMFAATRNIENVFLYLINIAIPVEIISYGYRKKMDLPHLIIYTSLGILISFFVLVLFRGQIGYYYLSSYLKTVDLYTDIQTKAIELVMQQKEMMFSEDQLELIKENVVLTGTLLKLIYPALFMLGTLVLSTLFILMITLVGKLKKWRVLSIKQLVRFKLSKFAVLLYIIGWFLLQMTGRGAGVKEMLGLNIFFLMQSIFRIVGIISLLTVVKRLSIGVLGRALLILASLILFLISPNIIMIVGLCDTLFDYRKVPIVV